MAKRKIYWFAHYDMTCPSTRYRGMLPLQELKSQGSICFNFYIPQRNIKGIIRLLKLLLKAIIFDRNSVVVIQKNYTNKLYATTLKALVICRPKHTIYDIDDAEYIRFNKNTINFFIKKCEKVHVGSKALAKYALNLNRNVTIITSPVSLHSILKNDFKKKVPLSIGWVGDTGNSKGISKTFNHKKNLQKLLFPALLKLNFNVTVTLIGVKNPLDIEEFSSIFRGSPYIKLTIPKGMNWKNDNWLYKDISKFDIGVSPLIHHAFNDAKSAFKAKQYMSCGIPAVVSDIGENSTFVKNGFNGYLFNDVNELVNIINSFNEMSLKKYKELCLNAKKSEKHFSMNLYCESFLNSINCFYK